MRGHLGRGCRSGVGPAKRLAQLGVLGLWLAAHLPELLVERDRALQLLLQQQRPLDVRASIRRLDRQRQLLRFLALRRVGSNTFGSGAAELVGKTPGAWRVRALATIVPCSAHAPCSVQVQARSSAISSCWLSYRPYGTTPSPALPRASAGPPHAHRSCARGPSIAATKERPSGVSRCAAHSSPLLRRPTH